MRVGFVVKRNARGEPVGEKIPIGNLEDKNTAILDQLTKPIMSAYERYLEACKKRGIEPG